MNGYLLLEKIVEIIMAFRNLHGKYSTSDKITWKKRRKWP